LIDNDLNEIKDIIDFSDIGNMTKVKEEEMLLKFVNLADHSSIALKMEWEKSKKMFYSRWWSNLNK
jgi:hypothetical protein